MKNYKICVSLRAIANYDIEAETEEEAREKIESMLSMMSNEEFFAQFEATAEYRTDAVEEN